MARKGDGASQVLPAGCDKCRGAPFVVNEHGAGRCTCDRGIALRRLDQRRPATANRDDRIRKAVPARKRTAIAPERAWWW